MDCPFRVGAAYRVRKDFQAFRDVFHAGEVLVFQSEAFSRYDDMTGYFFLAVGGDQRIRSWDVDHRADAIQSQDVRFWAEFFEPVSLDGTGAG